VIVKVCASRNLKSELIRGYLEDKHAPAHSPGPPAHPRRVLVAFHVVMRLSLGPIGYGRRPRWQPER